MRRRRWSGSTSPRSATSLRRRPGTSAPALPIRCARGSRAAASARCGTASSRPARSSSRLRCGTRRGGWPSTSLPSRRRLHEWSPYSRVFAPHLDGFFRTSHGEFRLVALDGGRTRLEGRTWYTLDMQPAMYWTAIADTILHAIHGRVLEHVKSEAERGSPVASAFQRAGCGRRSMRLATAAAFRLKPEASRRILPDSGPQTADHGQRPLLPRLPCPGP